MLPFCGYNMGDYFGHWLDMAGHVRKLPRIFHVNWFRKSAEGKFLWPGYGENMRVLEWIVKRCNGQASAIETKVGLSPSYDEFNSTGLENFTQATFDQVMALDNAEWQAEIAGQEEFFTSLGEHLPKELLRQRELLAARMA